MASVSVAEQVKTGVSGLITKPARMTVLCFVSFVVVALACQPRNQHFAGEAQEEGVFANPSSLHDGDVAECSSILKTYSETHHVHSWEQGIVAGSATLTIVSIIVASAARGKHVEGAYAGTGLAIMLESILFYALLHSGQTTVYCVGTPGGGVRLEAPLRYAYWVATSVQMQCALYCMVGGLSHRQRALSMAAAVLSVLCSFGAAMTGMGSPASVFLILCALLTSCVWIGTYMQQCALVRKWPEERTAFQRSILFCVPFATAFPTILIPIAWAGSYSGRLHMDTALLLLCVGEFMDKFTMCNLLAVSDLPQHIDKVRLELLEAEAKRSAAQAKESAMRSIIRYLFHELRVPLNSVVLGIEDSQEVMRELLYMLDVAGVCEAPQRKNSGWIAGDGSKSEGLPSTGQDTIMSGIRKATRRLQSACPAPAAPTQSGTPVPPLSHFVRMFAREEEGRPAAVTGGGMAGIAASDLAAARTYDLQLGGHSPSVAADKSPVAVASSKADVPAAAAESPSPERTGLGTRGSDASASGSSVGAAAAVCPVAHSHPHHQQGRGYAHKAAREDRPQPRAWHELHGSVRAALDDVTRILCMCHGSALGLGRLLDDFLSLEKIEQGKLKMEMGNVQVKRMVDETLRLFEPAMESKKLRLQRFAAPGIPSDLYGDDHKLRQCLANFVSNAIKFSPTEGTIRLQLSVVYVERPHGVGGGFTTEGGRSAPEPTPPTLAAHASTALQVHTAPAGQQEGDKVSVPVRTEGSDGGMPPTGLWTRARSWLGAAPPLSAAPTATSPTGQASSTPSSITGSSVSLEAPSPAAASPSAAEGGPGGAGAGAGRREMEMYEDMRAGTTPFLRVSVQDSGVGISPADQAKLFQPFQQIRAGALQKGNGTGLGLAIVRQIIQLSGGFVGVQSVEGQGSTFYFCVPLVAESKERDSPTRTAAVTSDSPLPRPLSTLGGVGVGTPPLRGTGAAAEVAILTSLEGGDQTTTTTLHSSRSSSTDGDSGSVVSGSHVYVAPSSSPIGGGGPSGHSSSLIVPPSPMAGDKEGGGSDSKGTVKLQRVVVVDDIQSNRQLLVRMLKRRGVAECWECADGTEAVALAEQLAATDTLHTVQAWLLDEEMPIMNGSKAIAILRSPKFSVRACVLSITGNALAEDQAALVAAGADGVLPKPVQLQNLQHVLLQHGLALSSTGRPL